MQRRFVTTAFLGFVMACSISERDARTVSEGVDTASGAAVTLGRSNCAPDAASKFSGDTTLFGVRNECGRWDATPEQRDSTTLHTGFRDSVRFVLAACPAAAPVDTLVYGSIGSAEETGDASGVQFIFERRGAWFRGVHIEGAGGISAPASLRGLALGSGENALQFWVPTAPRTILLYQVTLDCDQVTGTFRFRNFADARYDDGASLSGPRAFSLPRSPVSDAKLP